MLNSKKNMKVLDTVKKCEISNTQEDDTQEDDIQEYDIDDNIIDKLIIESSDPLPIKTTDGKIQWQNEYNGNNNEQFSPPRYSRSPQNYNNNYNHNYHNKNNGTQVYYNQNNLRNIFCVNCGEKGHVVKDCSGPITSFGIIAFKKVNNEYEEKYDTNDILKDILKNEKFNYDHKEESYPKIKYLMIQRKDTMGFIDFIRGKYDNRPGFEDVKSKKINVCLEEMTKKEKQTLLTKDFDYIWNDLWVNHDSRCYKNEYELAKRKFNNLDIPNLVKNSTTSYSFQEFGFPKGRRNMKETYIACAEREFFEETGFNKECYDFIKGYPKITEEFMGTNDVPYRHIYYLVKMRDHVHAPKIDLYNKVQTGEVRNIGWFTLNECLLLIRPYDTAKKNVIKKVDEDIINMNDNFNCSKIFYSQSSSKELDLYKINEIYTESDEYLIESNF